MEYIYQIRAMDMGRSVFNEADHHHIAAKNTEIVNIFSENASNYSRLDFCMYLKEFGGHHFRIQPSVHHYYSDSNFVNCDITFNIACIIIVL